MSTVNYQQDQLAALFELACMLEARLWWSRDDPPRLATMFSVAIVLVCVNCDIESSGSARGWLALLTGEEGEVDGVEIFCPRCAREEFGAQRCRCHQVRRETRRRMAEQVRGR